MELEQYITQAANRGWSRRMTAEALCISRFKLCSILEAMPPLKWATKGEMLRARNLSGDRQITEKLVAAAKRAQEARRLKTLYTLNGEEGSFSELLPKTGMSATSLLRRLRVCNWDMDEAVKIPLKRGIKQLNEARAKSRFNKDQQDGHRTVH